MVADEDPKPQTTAEQMAKLPPVFKKDGVVTAASASGFCDGAAAVVLVSEEAVSKNGFTPLARIVGYRISGCEPTIMGICPVPSIRATCDKMGVSLAEVDQVEINEAFGAQALSCQKELEIPTEKFNTCGGAIAIGHPMGATGSRISAHLVHKLKQNNQKYGMGSACILQILQLQRCLSRFGHQSGTSSVPENTSAQRLNLLLVAQMLLHRYHDRHIHLIDRFGKTTAQK